MCDYHWNTDTGSREVYIELVLKTAIEVTSGVMGPFQEGNDPKARQGRSGPERGRYDRRYGWRKAGLWVDMKAAPLGLACGPMAWLRSAAIVGGFGIGGGIAGSMLAEDAAEYGTGRAGW